MSISRIMLRGFRGEGMRASGFRGIRLHGKKGVVAILSFGSLYSGSLPPH